MFYLFEENKNKKLRNLAYVNKVKIKPEFKEEALHLPTREWFRIIFNQHAQTTEKDNISYHVLFIREHQYHTVKHEWVIDYGLKLSFGLSNSFPVQRINNVYLQVRRIHQIISLFFTKYAFYNAIFPAIIIYQHG